MLSLSYCLDRNHLNSCPSLPIEPSYNPSLLNSTVCTPIWSKECLVVYGGKLASFLPELVSLVFFNGPDLKFLPVLVTCFLLFVLFLSLCLKSMFLSGVRSDYSPPCQI